MRFVKLLHGAGGDRWDDHGDITGRIPEHCQEIDKPVAGLLADLKAPRTARRHAGGLGVGDGPHAVRQQPVTPTSPGRDHNQYGLVVWMAGGDVKPGATLRRDGRILRYERAGDEVPLRDVHATMLRLMGLDQNRLTYLHAGRYKKLTDIGGRVIKEIIA